MGSRSRLASLMRLAFSPKYLLFTNTGIGIMFFPAGDMLSQLIEHALGGPPAAPNAPAPSAPPTAAVTSNAIATTSNTNGGNAPTSLAARKTDPLRVPVPPLPQTLTSNRKAVSPVAAESATANTASDEVRLELLPPAEALAQPVSPVSTLTALNAQPESSALGFVYDYQRARNTAVIGAALGPFLHAVYIWMDRVLGTGNSARTVLYKLALDTVINAPVTDLSFLVGMPLLEGRDWRSSWSYGLGHFPNVFLVDLLYWMPVQAINFYVLPTHMRVLYVGFTSIIWNGFLSFYHFYIAKRIKKRD